MMENKISTSVSLKELKKPKKFKKGEKKKERDKILLK